MVKKLLILIAYFMFFVSALIYFTPKISIYNYAEKELLNYDVIISNETLEDSGLSLNIVDADIYVKSIQSANIKELDIMLLAIYNSVSLENITLSNAAASFVPLNIEYVNIHHSIFNPLNVYAHASGEFGEVDATFNVTEMSLKLTLIPSDQMSKNYKNTMRQLSKNEDGSYSYDKSF